jgi:hypothetical protein
MDQGTIIYRSCPVEFSQRLGNQNMRIRNEIAGFDEDIEIGWQVWEDRIQP